MNENIIYIFYTLLFISSLLYMGYTTEKYMKQIKVILLRYFEEFYVLYFRRGWILKKESWDIKQGNMWSKGKQYYYDIWRHFMYYVLEEGGFWKRYQDNKFNVFITFSETIKKWLW